MARAQAGAWRAGVTGAAVAAGLYALSVYDYAVFHTVVEVFSTVIAFSAFVLVWNARRMLDDDYLLLLGVSFLFFAVLDVPHMLAYQGIQLFEGFTNDLPTQIYIAQRYMLAASFLAAPAFVRRRLNLPVALAVYGAYAVVVSATLFVWPVFPSALVEGVGLTPFKVFSEYVIALMFLGSLEALHPVRERFATRTLLLIAGATVAFIASEMLFTLYGTPTGPFNLAGHLTQVLAFALVYGAIVRDGLQLPYTLIYRDLAEQEQRFRGTFEQAAVGVAQVDPDGRFTKVNDRFAEMLRYPREELERRTFRGITPPEDVPADEALLEELASGRRDTARVEKRWIAKDGSVVWVLLTASAVRDERGGVEYYVAVAEDITPRKIAEAERERVLGELEAIRAITDVALSSLRLEDLLDRILRRLLDVMRADVAFLLVRQGGDVVVRAAAGIEVGEAEHRSVPVGSGFAGEIAATGAPLYVEDAQTDERVLIRFIRDRGVRSMLGVPLREGDAVIAVLHVDWLVIHPFDPDELRLLELAADRIARAFSNARLYEETAEARRLGDALNVVNESLHSSLSAEHAMGQAVLGAQQAIGTDTALVILREDDGWHVRYESGAPEVRGMRLGERESGILQTIRRTGEPLVVEDLYADPRMNRRFLEEFGLRSALAVPLILRGDVVGALVMFHRRERHPFRPAQVDFARRLATSLALAVENARLYEGERQVAETLQDALISVPTEIEGMDVAHTYRSATETARVGGDFYDAFEVEHGCVGLLIDDVSGKGVEAAVLTALVRNVIRSAAMEQGKRPAEIVARTNELVFRESPPDLFVTLLFGIFDTRDGKLTYCNAGHTTGLVKREGAGLIRLPASSPLVGAFTDVRFFDAETTLRPGDTLYLYTDGLIEARSEAGLLGEERLARMILDAEDGDLDAGVARVLDAVTAWAGGSLSDDAALLAVRWAAQPLAPPDRQQELRLEA